jgi:hypothetical protein
MKFELFDNKGVFQPIEFILASVFIVVLMFWVMGSIEVLDSIPWLNDKIYVTRWWHYLLLGSFLYNNINKQ